MSERSGRPLWSTGAAVLLAVITTACSPVAGGAHPDNAAALDDIRAGRSGDEVVVEGVVSSTQRASNGPSGTHERFSIVISAGGDSEQVLIADNISVGERAPVRRGDDVIVKGVLEVDENGPVIHWTHHDPSYRHPGGFVILHGTTYD